MNVEPPEGNEIRMEYAGSLEDVVEMHKNMIQSGIQVVWFREHEANLEEVYFALHEGTE